MGKIDANDMGYAVKNDPQFHLPKYPYFSKSFELLFFDDSIAIDGLEEIQMFKGKDSVSLLPKIIKLLDGHHSLNDISTLLSEPFSKIFNTVALLYTRGFIQEGSSDDTDVFLEKFIDHTRLNTNIKQVYKKITDASFTFCSSEVIKNEYVSLDIINNKKNEDSDYYVFEIFSQEDFKYHYNSINRLYINNKKIFIIKFNKSNTHLFFLEKNHTYSLNDLKVSSLFKFEKYFFDKNKLHLIRTTLESVIINFIGGLG
ncbi:TPA: hypothetical protein REW68_001074, partial [Staphylococcus pseudintermedius]|nr:hypothetical protein [Staphylococcus pseudintermedius]